MTSNGLFNEYRLHSLSRPMSTLDIINEEEHIYPDMSAPHTQEIDDPNDQSEGEEEEMSQEESCDKCAFMTYLLCKVEKVLRSQHSATHILTELKKLL